MLGTQIWTVGTNRVCREIGQRRSEKLTLTVQMPHTVLLEINCLQRSHRGYAKEFTSFLKTVNAPALLGGCFHKFVRESVFKLYNFPRGCSNLFQW